jgi:hypothetical protein
MNKGIVSAEQIALRIRLFRGQKVLFDSDLARLYGVTTGNLNKAVNRNRERFPKDFVFQLTAEEAQNLIFQIGRSKARGGRRHFPYAFTEQGASFDTKANLCRLLLCSWRSFSLSTNLVGDERPTLPGSELREQALRTRRPE